MSTPTTLQKICQCICCSTKACAVAQCIDTWHGFQSCQLAYLSCDSCCWAWCAPLFIDCKLGQFGQALNGCIKCFKQLAFGCSLGCIGTCDGCYNGFKVAQLALSTGVKGYSDLLVNRQVLAKKVQDLLGLQTGNQPIKTMQTFTP